MNLKTFSSYVDSLNEFKILNLRLDYLMLKQHEISVKYLGVKSPSLEEMQQHSSSGNDKVVAYLYEYEQRVQSNGKTLKAEIEEIYQEMKILMNKLREMEAILKKLDSIEYRLFYYIAVEGLRPKTAVERAARDYHYSERNVWRSYDVIKPELKRIKK